MWVTNRRYLPLGPLCWLTTLSLDAPFVALAWQELFARVWDTSLTCSHRLILLVSVWLGYAADRWLDGFSEDIRPPDRHHFYRQHRRGLLMLWMALFAGALITSLLYLPADQLQRGAWLVVAVLLYTLFAQTGRQSRQYDLVKAIGIGVLVWTSACLFAVPALDVVRAELFPVVMPPIPVFVLNCLMINCWQREREPGGSPGSRSLLWTTALAVGTAVPAWICTPPMATVHLVSVAALTSLALLWALHLHRLRFESTQRRTLADVCLMSPLLTLPAS